MLALGFCMSLKFIQLDSFYEQMFKIQDVLVRINSHFKTFGHFSMEIS